MIITSWTVVIAITNGDIDMLQINFDRLLKNISSYTLMSSLFAGLIISGVFYFYIFPRKTHNSKQPDK